MMKFAPAAAFVCATIPSAAAAQRLGGASASEISIVRVFLALLVCLILAVVAITVFRKRLELGGTLLRSRLSRHAPRIRVLESRRISTQAEVSLIEVDDAQYLLLLNAGSLMLLREQPAVREAEEE